MIPFIATSIFILIAVLIICIVPKRDFVADIISGMLTLFFLLIDIIVYLIFWIIYLIVK